MLEEKKIHLKIYLLSKYGFSKFSKYFNKFWKESFPQQTKSTLILHMHMGFITIIIIIIIPSIDTQIHGHTKQWKSNAKTVSKSF